MKRVDIDIKELQRRLRYDPETGKLYWRVTEGGHVIEGREAFTADNKGYKRGGFFGTPLYAHVAGWILYHGKLPEGELDHINRNKQDNRIYNLRDVPKSVNQHNSKNRVDNSTGVCGVKRRKDTGRYEAQIQVNGKRQYLGRYQTLPEAIAAREAAEQQLL